MGEDEPAPKPFPVLDLYHSFTHFQTASYPFVSQSRPLEQHTRTIEWLPGTQLVEGLLLININP